MLNVSTNKQTQKDNNMSVSYKKFKDDTTYIDVCINEEHLTARRQQLAADGDVVELDGVRLAYADC